MTTSWASRFSEFHERAAMQVHSEDFGDDAYHEGMRVLLDALDDRPVPTGGKTATAEALVVGALASRLHTETQWAANPGYRQRELPRPLIVIGVPRTGTTALHNLLSLDPQFQGIEKWLTGAPLVRPPRDEWDAHPQYRSAVAQVNHMQTIAPDVMKAHGVLAHEVDECIVPMAQSFCCNWFPSQLDIPVYDDWFLKADERLAFARYKDMLRLVGLNDDRRWLLKNPSHVFGIDALLDAFPDAIVIQTHRDPVASLASLVNLLGNILLAYTGEDIDRERRLNREATFYAEAVKRTMAAQDRQPERFVNIYQHDIRRNPLGVVEKIYDRADLTLLPEAREAMQAWAASNAEQSEGGHSYAKIADDAPIRAAFAEYIDQYGF